MTHPHQPTPPAPAPYPGQPPYPPGGQPGQPPYPPNGWPGAVAAPPAAPKRRGRLALLAAGGLVAVLAVGAGTAWGVSRLVGGGSATGDTLKIVWVLDFPDRERGASASFDTEDMFGAWLVGDAVVRAQPDGLIGYRLADGAQAWGAPAPQGSSLCGAAQALTDGRGAVALGSADSCGTVAGFDATSGTLTWKAKIPAPVREGRGPVTAPDLSVVGQQVVVRSDQELLGYSLADGRRLWRTTADDLLPRRGCRFRDTQGAGEQVVVTAHCAGGGEIDGLDPATGKARWRQELPAAQESDGVLSVDPLVSLPGLSNDSYAARDATGKLRATFGNPVDGTAFSDLRVNRSTAIDGPAVRPYLADADTLYLPTESANVKGKPRRANRIVAIDLATGKRRWVSSGHTDARVEPIRLDEQGLLAWEVGDRRDLAPRLVRIDRAGGTVTVLAEGPRSAGTEGEDAKILERDGVVVIVPWKHLVADSAITVLRWTPARPAGQ